MAKYNEKAKQLRKDYDLDKMHTYFKNIHLELILDLMTSCSQLRQRKVIESFFKEVFPEVKTEFIEIDGIYGKYRKMVVIEWIKNIVFFINIKNVIVK